MIGVLAFVTLITSKQANEKKFYSLRRFFSIIFSLYFYVTPLFSLIWHKYSIVFSNNFPILFYERWFFMFFIFPPLILRNKSFLSTMKVFGSNQNFRQIYKEYKNISNIPAINCKYNNSQSNVPRFIEQGLKEMLHQISKQF